MPTKEGRQGDHLFPELYRLAFFNQELNSFTSLWSLQQHTSSYLANLPEFTIPAPPGHDTAVTALISDTRTNHSTHEQVMPKLTVCNYTQELSIEVLGLDAATRPTNVLLTYLNRNKSAQLLNICHSLTLLDLVALHHRLSSRKICITCLQHAAAPQLTHDVASL